MASNPSNRRQPTRSARASAARPTNYYAKPFSYRTSQASLADNDPPLTAAPGFFPAITHFTDSLGALPREVQRHFTTLKETEGKAWQPDQAIAELVTAIRKLPPPPHPQHQDRPLPYMQLSTTNSVIGSVNGSVVDGVASRAPPTQTSLDVDMPDCPQLGTADEYSDRRQDLFMRLQHRVSEITKVLDEKAMVLTTANETLGHQLARLNGSFPHIENEVSDEARLGSNTHWALPHMKELRRTIGSGNERRRDVTNVNNLAAAAAAVHETEIAATRSEARREAMIAKRSRAPAADFGFDDRAAARKSTSSGKVRKTGDAAQPSVNGSSSNKRRRVEKPAVSTGGERAMSAAIHGRLGQPNRNGSRESNTTTDASRKKSKPLPVQAPSRKKNQANSPSVASSPTRGTFATSTVRTSSPARAQNSRVRQPSDASLIHDASRKHATTVSSSRKQDEQDTVVAQTNNKQDERSVGAPDTDAKAPFHEEPKRPSSTTVQDADSSVKRELPTATPATDSATAPPTSSHSRTNSRSAGTGQPAKPTTPHNIFADVAPLMSRSRSGRGVNNAPAASPTGVRSGAASPTKRSHKRGGGSNANARDAAAAIAAVAAPATAASPASSDDERPEAQQRARRPRNGKINGAPGGPAAPTTAASAPAMAATAATGVPTAATATAAPPARAVGESAGAATDEDEDEGEGMDGSSAERDEAEPLYCFCQQPSEGEMIACDNEACPTEWFHLECVQLARAPKNSWFCSEGCKRQALRGKR